MVSGGKTATGVCRPSFKRKMRDRVVVGEGRGQRLKKSLYYNRRHLNMLLNKEMTEE